MIVACPNCTSKYRLQDGPMGSAGVKMKCPKCALVFSAQPSEVRAPAAVSAPAPVSVPAPGGVVGGAGQEWDSMMAGALDKAFAPPAPAAAATVPADFDPLAEVLLPGESPAAAVQGPVPHTAEPRDPFYEDNPLVVERPPADAATSKIAPQPSPTRNPRGYASSSAFPSVDVTAPVLASSPAPAPALDAQQPFPNTRSDPFLNISMAPGSDIPASSPAPHPSAPTETSDPFACISVMAPSSVPVAGEGSEGGMPGSPEPGGVAGKVCIKDRAGLIREFDNLAIARSYVTQHADLRGLEISVDETPFQAVLQSEHFANVSMGVRDQTSRLTLTPSTSFPPAPQVLAVEADSAQGSGLFARIGLVISALLFVASGLFAAWQFDLIPVDPGLTQLLASQLHLTTPLMATEMDRGQRAQQAWDRADLSEKQGILTEAAIYYRAALEAQPNDARTREALHRCLKLLGDDSKAKNLLSVSAPR